MVQKGGLIQTAKANTVLAGPAGTVRRGTQSVKTAERGQVARNSAKSEASTVCPRTSAGKDHTQGAVDWTGSGTQDQRAPRV